MPVSLKLRAAARWSSKAWSITPVAPSKGWPEPEPTPAAAVVINGATVTGGTLNTLGTGVNASSMSFYGIAILNGVTNNGTIALPNNNQAELEGTITNNGSIQVNSSGNNTFLYIDGNTTLNGNGTIVLTNNPNNFVYGVAGTEVLTNNGNTIEGSGDLGNGNLGVVNNAGGTILANQPNELFIRSEFERGHEQRHLPGEHRQHTRRHRRSVY